MTGALYLVPTPVGNLEDITLRALRVLRECSLIAAEDTRTTGRLLAHFGIEKPQISYHEHNRIVRLDAILRALETGDVALVSDAGTPALSDPGYELVRAALDAGVQVIPLPGPNALLPALTASGLPTESFLFLGFLPRKAGERRAALDAVAALPHTLVLYEAPHRVVETLEAILASLGDRSVVLAREISKLYEEFWRGPAAQALAHFQAQTPRGEFVILIAPCQPEAEARWPKEQLRAALAERLAAGDSRSSAAKALAALSGWPRREIYDLDSGVE